MANRISQYGNAGDIENQDEFVMVDKSNTINNETGETEKRTFEDIKNAIGNTGEAEEFDNGDSGSAVTINWNNGQHQRLTLTDDCAITFSNPSFVGRYDVRIIQGGAGNFDVTGIPGIFPEGQPQWDQGETGDEILLTVRFDGANYLAFDSGYYNPS